MTTQELIIEDISGEASQLLDQLELVWRESTSHQDLLTVLKTMTATAIHEKDLKTKRMVVQVMSVLKKMVKKLKQEKIALNTPSSFEKLIGLLKELEFYTTLYTLKIDTNLIKNFQESWSQKDASTPSYVQNIPTISISYMTAPIQKEDVVVPSLNLCEDEECQELDEILGIGSGTSEGIFYFII